MAYMGQWLFGMLIGLMGLIVIIKILILDLMTHALGSVEASTALLVMIGCSIFVHYMWCYKYGNALLGALIVIAAMVNYLGGVS